jgi:hypothetical protein
MLGEHNAAVLQGELGIGADECAALQAAGVIGRAGSALEGAGQ